MDLIDARSENKKGKKRGNIYSSNWSLIVTDFEPHKIRSERGKLKTPLFFAWAVLSYSNITFFLFLLQIHRVDVSNTLRSLHDYHYNFKRSSSTCRVY